MLTFLRQIRLENTSQNQLQYYLERLEVIVSGTERIKDVLLSSHTNDPGEISILNHYRRSIGELLMDLNEVYTEIDSCLDTYLSQPITAYQSERIQSGRRGRPRFHVTANQLSYLTSLSFTWIQIATMLGISRMTLYRRRVEFGMVHEGHVIRDKVRRAIHETDPINTALRATAAPLSRRVYNVPGPNSLWHVGEFNITLSWGFLIIYSTLGRDGRK